MRKQIVTSMAVCAAGLVLSAFGQNSSTTPGGTTTDQSTSPSTSPAGSSTFDNTRRPTGRMSQELRASKLMNSEVRNSQGQSLGTIHDIVLNPSSGRIDFAAISLDSSPSASSTTTTLPSTSSSTSSTDRSSGGKLVAVPWMLLRSSTLPSSSVAGVSSSTLGQPTFVFAGDSSKLMSAPSFDQSNWPDITQYSWRQSIYSHFGMSAGSATGGATSPGGYDSNTGSSIPRNSSSTPGSSSSTLPSQSPSSPDNPGK